MSERTYLFGYQEQRLTLSQLDTKWTWSHLHPEIRRRLVAMMNACQDAGYDCGIGEGARSTADQLTTFLSRHTRVTSGGCCTYNGGRYALRPGKAPIAPLGSSVHEDQLYEGYALAADLRGWENHWFDVNCMRFGLKNFGGAVGPNVNNEEWHFQPLEFANSRSAIVNEIRSGKRLRVFPLPGDLLPPPVIKPDPVGPQPPQPVLEEDTMVVVIIKDTRTGAVWTSNGSTKAWVQDGQVVPIMDYRVAECANGTRPSGGDSIIYREVKTDSDLLIASYGPVVGPHPGHPYDAWGRLIS